MLMFSSVSLVTSPFVPMCVRFGYPWRLSKTNFVRSNTYEKHGLVLFWASYHIMSLRPRVAYGSLKARGSSFFHIFPTNWHFFGIPLYYAILCPIVWFVRDMETDGTSQFNRSRQLDVFMSPTATSCRAALGPLFWWVTCTWSLAWSESYGKWGFLFAMLNWINMFPNLGSDWKPLGKWLDTKVFWGFRVLSNSTSPVTCVRNWKHEPKPPVVGFITGESCLTLFDTGWGPH